MAAMIATEADRLLPVAIVLGVILGVLLMILEDKRRQ